MVQFDLKNEEVKTLMKEAIKEAFAEQVTKFGWFSLRTLAAGGLVTFVYIILWSNGWHHQ